MDKASETIIRLRAQLAASEARVAELEMLLREAWDFPDMPTVGDGLSLTEDDAAEQDEWRLLWDALDARVSTAEAAGARP